MYQLESTHSLNNVVNLYVPKEGNTKKIALTFRIWIIISIEWIGKGADEIFVIVVRTILIRVAQCPAGKTKVWSLYHYSVYFMYQKLICVEVAEQ